MPGFATGSGSDQDRVALWLLCEVPPGQAGTRALCPDGDPEGSGGSSS